MPAGHRAPTHPRLAAVVRPAMFLGCTRAMELILSRVWPARRGRSVLLPDLPTIRIGRRPRGGRWRYRAGGRNRPTPDEEGPDPFPKDRGGRPKVSE